MALVKRLELMVGGDSSGQHTMRAEPSPSHTRSGDMWSGASARMLASQGTKPSAPAADTGTYSTF